MIDRDTDRGPGTGARLLAVMGGLVSFRVAIALSTSVAVTGAVAGPLTLLALRVDEPEVAAAPATTAPRRAAPSPGAPASQPPPQPPPTVAPPTTAPLPDAEPLVRGRVLRTPTTAPTSTTTTVAGQEPPLLGTGLAAGASVDRGDRVDLDGSTVTGRVYLFVTQPGVTAARWWLDRTPTSGPPTRSSTTPPFDLGVSTFDTSTLAVGKHSVYVEFDTPQGVTRRAAIFDVVR